MTWFNHHTFYKGDESVDLLFFSSYPYIISGVHCEVQYLGNENYDNSCIFNNINTNFIIIKYGINNYAVFRIMIACRGVILTEW